MTDAGDAFDFIVAGGGMAGVSAAYFLASHGRVLLLEQEAELAYHTTGRSAAMYLQTYGNRVVRALTVGCHDFYLDPPAGFAEHPVLAPRGALQVARADQLERLGAAHAEVARLVANVELLDPAATRALVPVLRADYVAGGLLEPDAMDMDVHAIHQGFTRGLRARGGRVETGAAVRALEPGPGGWTVATARGRFAAPVVVNAAGAWGDHLAGLAGVAPVGLVPKRRTAIVFPPPAGLDVGGWPLCIDVDETFYFKPEAGNLLGSPADETPAEPSDAQPEELDVALAADRIERATTLAIRRITHRWAGLRTFAPDKTPVVGFEAGRGRAGGFFWLVGQGGYGIQTAPALGRLAAALIVEDAVPADLAALGVRAEDLSPARLR